MKFNITRNKKNELIAMTDKDLNNFYQEYQKFPNIIGQLFINNDRLKNLLEDDENKEKSN